MDDRKKQFLDAMCFRHACKLFDDTQPVSSEDEDFLLEIARLSPSSLGLEHWKFIVVRDATLKRELQRACMDQPQVGTASLIVAILARTSDLHPDSPYVEVMLRRLATTDGEFRKLVDFYRAYSRGMAIAEWSVAQCHLAAANMMTAAAFIGIDSCPIGAFDPDSVHTILQFDTERFRTALLLTFGYRKRPRQPLHRLPLAEIVEFR